MRQHTLEASQKPIFEIFCDRYLFRVPTYQRPYSWTTEQTSDLLEDVSTACSQIGDIRKLSPYFLGSIVLIKDPQSPDADIVDGQQRLTTITILLSVLRDLADKTLADDLEQYICVPGRRSKGTQDVLLLTLRDRDARFFQDRIQTRGATEHLPPLDSLRDTHARLIENAQFLRTKLAEWSSEERERLAMFLTQRCFLVVVAASDQESAFRIFSVLNSRGLDLSPADILKAEIIGALPADDQDEYTNRWEDLEEALGRTKFADLIGHIRMIHRKQKMQESLITEFREFVPARQNPSRFIDEELTPYADAYEEITNNNFPATKHAKDIKQQIVHLTRLDHVDWQPPAIEVIARYRSDPDFILRFLSDFERLAYGLFLMRKDSSERIRRYGKLLASIQAGDDLFDDNSPLQLDSSEKEAILRTLNGDIYTITRIRLPLLLRIDQLLAGGSAAYDSAVVTVEHVLPQNPAPGSQWQTDFPLEADREQWVHKLANLVLLTRRKNAQASNSDFVEKKARYFQTKGGIANFALTSSINAEAVWTPETLQRRQATLIAAVEKAWRLN